MNTTAQRQKRFRETLAAQGVRAVNVLAPVETHEIIREFARRTREGEDPARVLGSLYRKADGRSLPGLELPDLAVPEDLQPGPGEVAIALRPGRKASGHVKAMVRNSGLLRSEAVGGWVGVLPAAQADDLERRVLAGGGAALRRDGGAVTPVTPAENEV